MAIAGNNTWIPSNQAKLIDGQVQIIGSITQNKPRTIVCRDVEEAVRRLQAGEIVIVDVRHEFMSKLREALGNGHTD